MRKTKKIAIVHDELVRRGGAEQVTLLLHRAFPDAPIYTSCYNEKNTYPEFQSCNVKSSWLSRIVKNDIWLKRLFYPFSILAMRSIDLSEYDIVLISTTNCAKYVKTDPKNLFIAFCHYPFRLAWFPDSYDQVNVSRGLKKKIYSFVINRLKKIDYYHAKKIDWFITNTKDIACKIQKCYNPINPVSIISASIPCSNFYVEENPSLDYYLVVSRIEDYKRVDIVISAFNEMADKKLIIVGNGSKKDKLKSIANANIKFMEGLTKEELSKLYSNCKALIFPQIEDYGLTPLEANASGRPVIAFGYGGVTTTMIPYNGNNINESTALFFYNQNYNSLKEVITEFEYLKFNSNFIRSHSEKFDENIFIEKIKSFVISKLN